MDWESVSAGPLLDARMARTLWRALVVHDAANNECYMVSDDHERVPVPAYSTVVDDAHRVAAFMQSHGWTLSIKQTMDDDNVCYVALFGKTDGRIYNYTKAETMPLAICLAALWAWSGGNVKI